MAARSLEARVGLEESVKAAARESKVVDDWRGRRRRELGHHAMADRRHRR